MANSFELEVLDLHTYLEHWLKGIVPKGDGRPARLIEALSNDFVVIHPSGSRGTKSDVLAAFAAAYGAKPASYALEIGLIQTRMIAADTCLAIYEERHRGEPGRARISTAVLKRRQNGGTIEWLFLQETLAPHLDVERRAAE